MGCFRLLDETPSSAILHVTTRLLLAEMCLTGCNLPRQQTAFFFPSRTLSACRRLQIGPSGSHSPLRGAAALGFLHLSCCRFPYSLAMAELLFWIDFRDATPPNARHYLQLARGLFCKRQVRGMDSLASTSHALLTADFLMGPDRPMCLIMEDEMLQRTCQMQRLLLAHLSHVYYVPETKGFKILLQQGCFEPTSRGEEDASSHDMGYPATTCSTRAPPMMKLCRRRIGRRRCIGITASH